MAVVAEASSHASKSAGETSLRFSLAWGGYRTGNLQPFESPPATRGKTRAALALHVRSVLRAIYE